MRVSSAQIFDAGSLGIQRNQSSLFKLQNQLSTGRRILAPEDDPIAAAQALVVSQAKAINEQHIVNQGNAKAQLASLEDQLGSVTELLQNVRERVIQAGNMAMSDSDRLSMATEIESRLQELLGIANTQDGTGQYLFSGFRGATLPFALNAAGQVAYSGDNGERLLQVGDSRQIPTNLSGADVFMEINSGNGVFAATSAGNSGGGINQGTARIDAGAVLDQASWQNALNAYPAGGFSIEFSVAAGVTTYQIYDSASPVPNALLNPPAPFTPGQIVRLEQTETSPPLATAPADFGAQVVIKGQPADGDTFAITPSASQDMFRTLQNLVGLLRQPLGSPTMSTTEYNNRLDAELTNIDRAFDNLGRVTAAIGTRMKEVDSLKSTAEDVGIQHDETLSDLQDLDYAKTISDFMRQQMNLEAAQQSYARISQLSLFDVL